MRIVLLGAPGAGKGTQCKKIAEKYRLAHLSSGDILRQERSAGSELGKKAQSFMDSGALVPDQLIVEMMRSAIKAAGNEGFVLDGFPRTINQAEQLDKVLTEDDRKIDAVLNLKVSDNVIIRRITGRRSCTKCGAVYHIENMKSKTVGICDKCGGKLVQRSDDTEKVVKSRLENYYLQTAPVVDYYRKNNTVYDINADKSPDEVISMIFKTLDGLRGLKMRNVG